MISKEREVFRDVLSLKTSKQFLGVLDPIFEFLLAETCPPKARLIKLILLTKSGLLQLHYRVNLNLDLFRLADLRLSHHRLCEHLGHLHEGIG